MLNDLLERAAKHAEAYDVDDRQDIKTDVLNAFYAGAAFGAQFEREACAKLLDAEELANMPSSAENNGRQSDFAFGAAESSRRMADAIRMRSNDAHEPPANR